MLPAAMCADDDVGVGDVRGSACYQEPADIRRVHPVEGDNVGRWLAGQSRQPYLLFGPADRLGESGRWDGDAGGCLAGAGKEHHHTAVIAVQGRYQVLSTAQEPGVSPDPSWIDQNFSARAAAHSRCTCSPRGPVGSHATVTDVSPFALMGTSGSPVPGEMPGAGDLSPR